MTREARAGKGTEEMALEAEQVQQSPGLEQGATAVGPAVAAREPVVVLASGMGPARAMGPEVEQAPAQARGPLPA